MTKEDYDAELKQCVKLAAKYDCVSGRHADNFLMLFEAVLDEMQERMERRERAKDDEMDQFAREWSLLG